VLLGLASASRIAFAQPDPAAHDDRLADASAAAADPGDAPGAPTDSSTIVAPRALDAMNVEYPANAIGDEAVMIELVIDAEGRVTNATAVEGWPPFSTAAEQAALAWRFEPARRGEQPILARIRVQVLFTPPVYEEIERPSAAAPSESTSPSGAAVGSEVEGQAEQEPEPVEVVVKGERIVGVKSLGRAEVRQMPGAFGDPYRAIEALPGVTPIVSGLPYFFVRGAPPGNVGYFFGETTVPLLFHVAAGPGVLHPAFVRSVDLYAGAYPARFGRYAGGIVAGEPADPEYRFRGEASIRIVDSGAFVEVPFADGRGSAMLAGRYSYTGLIVSLLAPEVSLGYWDYQGRIQYQLGPRDTVSLFGFGSHDFLSATNDAGVEQDVIDLTFHRLEASYARVLDARSNLRFTLAAGLDRTGLGGDPDEAEEEDPVSLLGRSFGGRLNYDNQLSEGLLVRAGADANLSRFSIDFNTDQEDDQDEDEQILTPQGFRREVLPVPGFPPIVLDPLFELQQDRGTETLDTRFLSRDDLIGGVWTDAVIDAGAGVTLTPGLRFDFYDTGGEVALAFEPRLAARFDLTENVSVTHAIGLAHQPPSSPIPIPGFSGAANDGLQQAIQTSAGVEAQLPAKILASATLFQNVILNSTDVFGASTLQSSDPEANAFVDRTTGHTYGLELYLRRSLAAKLGGFLSYTLSRSTRSVARLDGLSSFDRRHVINAGLAYNLGRRWRLGGRVSAYSGGPAEVAYAEAAENPPRTPWHWRLDWRLEKSWLIGTHGAWWAVVLEMLNTTLNEEVVNSSCYAYGCSNFEIGPVAVPSIGVEASF
jgi:TonB family protein